MSHKLSFIVVNYNTSEFLYKCVKNLLGITDNYEIIVVDNSSTDGSVELLRDSFNSELESGVVKLIESENRGLAHAQNVGLAASTGDYIVYLGTDAFPDKTAIAALLDFTLTHPDAGIVTPHLVLRDGTTDKDSHRGFPTLWSSFTHFLGLDKLFPRSRIFSQYFLSFEDLTTRHEIDLCISHFMFIPKVIHENVGKWDEDYFVFGEDVDLCYRVKQAGYKIYFLGDVKVLHVKGVGVGRKSSKDIKTVSNSSKDTKLRMTTETTRAMKLYFQKHHAGNYPVVLAKLVLAAIDLLGLVRRIWRVHLRMR